MHHKVVICNRMKISCNTSKIFSSPTHQLGPLQFCLPYAGSVIIVALFFLYFLKICPFGAVVEPPAARCSRSRSRSSPCGRCHLLVAQPPRLPPRVSHPGNVSPHSETPCSFIPLHQPFTGEKGNDVQRLGKRYLPRVSCCITITSPPSASLAAGLEFMGHFSSSVIQLGVRDPRDLLWAQEEKGFYNTSATTGLGEIYTQSPEANSGIFSKNTPIAPWKDNVSSQIHHPAVSCSTKLGLPYSFPNGSKAEQKVCDTSWI